MPIFVWVIFPLAIWGGLFATAAETMQTASAPDTDKRTS